MQLLNILKQKTEDEGVKRYAVSYMEATGSFEYCRRVLETLTVRAKRLCAELGDEGGAAGTGKGQGVLKILEKFAV